MTAPLLQENIKSAIKAAIEILKLTILQPILDTNIKLQESVKKNNITIQQQQEKLEEQGSQLSVNQDIITELEEENRFLSSELDSMKLNLYNKEQYGRRNL